MQDQDWDLTDEQLAEYLGTTKELVARLTPGMRRAYVHLAWVENELKEGRRPACAIVCEE